MLWALAAAGMQVGSALMGYQADKATAKAQQAFQKYRNTMTQLSNAMTQNAITSNELIEMEASKREALQIQGNYQEAAGAVQVQAGSAYTAGRSVDRSMHELKLGAQMAESVRQENLINAWQGYDAQRKNAAMSAAMQQDHSYIPTPKLSSYLFKAAANIASGQASGSGGNLMGDLSRVRTYFTGR